MSGWKGKCAVVIGAGMGGLAAAKALANHFEQVLVLDRDELPASATHRAGTPQSRHAHVLLCGGLRRLAQLYPGFQEAAVQAGAVLYDATLGVRLDLPGYDPFPQRSYGLTSIAASRPLIEFVTRRLLLQSPNVEIKERWRVQEILPGDGGGAIGVGCETSDGRRGDIHTDLIVDASGRGAPTLEFLKSQGLPLPEEEAIGMNMGYATALFAIPDDAPSGWKATIMRAEAPKTSRGGFLFPREGKQWIVTLAGMQDEKPPGDPDGFMSFARSLRTHTIYNAIARAERLTEIQRFALPASTLRHFERLEKFPRGLLPIADAVCRFNPAYGQGMTVSAMEAVLLDKLLSEAAGADPLSGLARSYFAEIQDLIRAPWSVASLDLAFPATSGARPENFGDTLKYGAGVTRLAARDPEVHRIMVEVQQLLRPSSALREPGLVERVKGVMAEAAAVRG